MLGNTFISKALGMVGLILGKKPWGFPLVCRPWRWLSPLVDHVPWVARPDAKPVVQSCGRWEGGTLELHPFGLALLHGEAMWVVWFLGGTQYTHRRALKMFFAHGRA